MTLLMTRSAMRIQKYKKNHLHRLTTFADNELPQEHSLQSDVGHSTYRENK